MSDPGVSGVATTLKSIAEEVPANLTPLVSISIITYNQVQWIRASVESALAQDYPHLEIVVADDASTDGTADVVQSLALEYPDIVKPVLSQVNEGITRNSNKALRQCTGKYVALCAGDDMFLPGKIRKQVAWMEEDDRRVLCGHYVRVESSDSTCIGIFRTGTAGEHGTGASAVVRNGHGSTFLGSCVMVRRSCIPSRGFDERMNLASDWKFIIDVVGSNGEWGTVQEVLSVYRRHEGNVTGHRQLEILEDMKLTLDMLVKEQPWLQHDIDQIRLLYDYECQKWRYFEHARGVCPVCVLWVVVRPPHGVRRLKALVLFAAMLVPLPAIRRALYARALALDNGVPRVLHDV
jgi:glycosyltransferase involved in cell wall biosynthesis